ncbi:MAG TPA: Lrp/AsnC family transcriptional regulator [Solirubrobacterales bacterium]|jgi:Lrp/AsnC family transcriptional regulator for asnA, asnC and gidA|nr:Lrp/AsnC family transcriptional regulator [Solirubrobacterales bacterium]
MYANGGRPGEAPLTLEELDELDRSIISQLQEDGRRPFRAIAEALEVPEGTVRFRVKRLQEQGVMRILAFVDPLRFGYQVSASVLLAADPGRHAEAVEALAGWPEVVYLSSCTGRANIYAHVVCASGTELLEILTDRLAGLPEVRVVETVTELDIHKARYVYPPRGQDG